MSIDIPKFTKINESFTCENCGYAVPSSASTCRDHCPKCLFSMHVDNNPGDRNANCGGLLQPTGLDKQKKKGYVIHYKCQKCGELKVNRFLENDNIESDDFNALLRLIK